MGSQPADSSPQQVVGGGSQRVITIVTDRVPLGNLPAASLCGSLSRPFLVMMQNGQQGEKGLPSPPSPRLGAVTAVSESVFQIAFHSVML